MLKILCGLVDDAAATTVDDPTTVDDRTTVDERLNVGVLTTVAVPTIAVDLALKRSKHQVQCICRYFLYKKTSLRKACLFF